MDIDRFASPAERAAARSLVSELLRRGYRVSVNDGIEWTVRASNDRQEILEALATTGMDTVKAWAEDDEGLHNVGSFHLIYQGATERDEVIYDYSANPICEEIWGIASGLAQLSR